ncbi:sigma-70 family RNA polymerase sigma factor [Gloeocapsa sp. PCC 73106]|uniref:sigma-70 family RNA polymerase sigma factor n=1 Tax=Gloeocapsa sp. PCC 73106 TaxID=102232 RepID=UPI0002AC5E88|nr:sigma-70 family RNA polymerase sigma factor [Gloeocapsa sp. PCC 73106]ELR96771.1 RNA polymerase sigma factor, sigma-70 family [Gloeocapsa sp. PCC 73106]
MSQSVSISWSMTRVTNLKTRVSPEHLSNYDLILRCQEGVQPNQGAFTELLRRYQTYVERILYHLAPDWQDRCDLSQEVWLRVYRYLSRLEDPHKFKSWLARITTNLFYDELRKRKRRSETVSLDEPRQLEDSYVTQEIAANAPTPEDDLATREFYEKLQQAIADLEPIFRTTIILREIEGMSYEEIAEITGVSLGTVKSRIARARAKLQSQLHNFL